MNFETPNFFPAIPEIFVLTMGCLILVIDLYIRQQNRVLTYLMTQATLVIAAVLTVYVHTGERVLASSKHLPQAVIEYS